MFFPILEFPYILVSIMKIIYPITMILSFFPFSYILVSIIKIIYPITMIFPFFLFPYILVSNRPSDFSLTVWFHIFNIPKIFSIFTPIILLIPSNILIPITKKQDTSFLGLTKQRESKKKEGEDDEYMSHLVSY